MPRIDCLNPLYPMTLRASGSHCDVYETNNPNSLEGMVVKHYFLECSLPEA